MSVELVAVELGRGTAALLATPAEDKGAVVSALGGDRPATLVVVHPVQWAPSRVLRLRRAAGGLADVVLAVPAALAAAAVVGHAAEAAGTRLAVLDVGSASTEATVLGAAGEPTVLACRGERIGGVDLDEAVLALVQERLPVQCLPAWRQLRDGIEAADAPRRRALRAELRRCLEVLSGSDQVRLAFDDPDMSVPLTSAALRPVLTPVLARIVDVLAVAVADAGIGPADWPPVLLVGDVAGTPLLAELVTERAGAAPTVPAEPGGASVRGALAVAGEPTVPSAGPLPLTVELPLPLPAPRPASTRIRSGIAAAAVATLLGTAALLTGPALSADLPAPQPAALLAQYDYTVEVPGGWRHTGGLPERRRSLLTPADRPGGSDLVSIEQTPLDYDAGVEPKRAAAELRVRYDEAVGAGSLLEGFEPGAAFAGRRVTTYRQRQPERDALVEWYVIFDGGAQLSVGCQYTRAGAAMVRAACEQAVASIRLRR